MENENLIPVIVFCKHYNVELNFIVSLNEIGLLEITTIEETQYLYERQLAEAEKIINLHNELGINIEGIDVIINLLQKVDELQSELKLLKNRLSLYE